MLTTRHGTDTVTRNLIVDYYDTIAAAAAVSGAEPGGPAGTPGFAPGFDLPELTDEVRDYFAAATATWRPLGEYRGHPLVLMDLTGNPGTRTTKTFPSLVIVARAVEHIRRTGRRICLVTPTSANKGVGLRDAVARALAAGLVTPDQLRVVVLAPASTAHKFRADALSADPALRAANPLLRYPGEDPEGVKALGRAFVDAHAARALAERDEALWFSLALPNYLVADTARAAFEAEVSPTGEAPPRWHAHAVSSAFGLLGYSLGRDLLEADGRAQPADRPGFLLVQHLGTPDMVLSLRHGSPDREHLPTYERGESGWTQAADPDPHYPAVTDDPDEVLDPTFYTRRPVTSPRMNALIERFGGDGIVVSGRECRERYPLAAEWLAGTGALPADPDDLREWSLLMALTGVWNAIDRGLVPPGREVVVHGSGSYAADFDVLPPAAVVSTVDEVAAAVLGA